MSKLMIREVSIAEAVTAVAGEWRNVNDWQAEPMHEANEYLRTALQGKDAGHMATARLALEMARTQMQDALDMVGQLLEGKHDE